MNKVYFFKLNYDFNGAVDQIINNQTLKEDNWPHAWYPRNQPYKKPVTYWPINRLD